MKQLPRFVGGSSDGEEVSAHHKIDDKRWPSVIYKNAKITIEQSRSLHVSEFIVKRWPEDVYYFNGKDYNYERTIWY